MGLDMYLMGRTSPEAEPTQIGYWRKHANLHGYFVHTFGNGVDDQKAIPLTREDLLKVCHAVRTLGLPHTTGFFFGASHGSQEERDRDILILEGAIQKMDHDPNYLVEYFAWW